MRLVLRERREQSGLTAKDLSLKLQANPSYISRVERGYRTLDVVEFIDIAEALQIQPHDLLRQIMILARQPAK